MLRIASLTAKAGIRDQAETECLISHLRIKGYTPLIRSMFTNMFDLVKIPEAHEQLITEVISESAGPRYKALYMRRLRYGTVLGELFVADDIIYTLLPIRVNRLQASAIGYGEQEQALQKFCQDVVSAIKIGFDGRRVRGMSFDWRSPPKRPSEVELIFEEEPEQGVAEVKLTEPTYTPEDVATAKLLVETNVR